MDIDTKYVAAALECIEDSHDYIQKALSNVQDASSSLNSRLKGRVRGFDGAINSLQMALGATKSIIGKCDAYIEETEKTVESIKELSTEFLLGLGQGPINEDLFNNPEKIKKELDAKREKRRQDEAKEQLKNDLMTWGYSETDADRLVKSAEEGKDLSEELQKLDKEIFEEYCSGDIDRFKAQTEAKVLQNMHYNREESEARKEEIERTISKLEKENDEIKKESKLYDKAVKRAHYDSKKGVYVYLDEKGVFHEFTEEEFDSLKDMQVKANASIEASNTATNNGINTLREELTTIEENLSNPNKKDFSYNSVEEIDKRIKEIEASLKKEKNPSLSQEKEELLNIKGSIAYILENGKYILQDDFNDKKTLDKGKAREKTHFDNGGNIVVNIFGIEDGKYTFMDSEEYRGALLARMLNGDAKIMPDLQGGALNVVGDNQEFNFYGKEFYFYGNERQLFFNEYQEWVNQSNTTDKKTPVVIAPQEVEIFNYICNKEGYDKGYEYLKGKEKEFDVRSVSIKKAQDSKTALENPWLGAVSIFTAPLEALTNVGKIITRKSAGENLHYSDMYSSSNTWNSAISGDLHRQSEVLGYAYDTLYSADRLMLSAVTSYGLGGGILASTALNAGLYGAPTFTNTLNAAKNKNINDLDAIRYALFCATSRTLATSHMVTSAMGIEGAFNNALSQGQVASKISSLVNGSSILSKNPELASNVLLTGYCMGSQGLISGTTALADQAITQTADILMNGDKSDLNIKFRNYKELHENATDLDAYAYLVGDALSSSFSTFATSFGAGALLGTVKADGYISHQKNLNQNVNFNEAFEGIPKNPQESFGLSNNNPSGGPSGGYHPTSNPSSDGEQGAKSSNVTNTSTSSGPGDWIVVRPKNSEDFDIDEIDVAESNGQAILRAPTATIAQVLTNDAKGISTTFLEGDNKTSGGHYESAVSYAATADGGVVANVTEVWIPDNESPSIGSIQQTDTNITDSIGVKVPVEASIDGKVVDAFTVINEKGGDSVILPFAPSFSTGSDSEISSVDWAKSTGAFTPPQIDILSKINNIGNGVVKDKTMSLDDFNYIYDKSGLPLNLKDRLIKQFEKDGIIKDKPVSNSVSTPESADFNDESLVEKLNNNLSSIPLGNVTKPKEIIKKWESIQNFKSHLGNEINSVTENKDGTLKVVTKTGEEFNVTIDKLNSQSFEKLIIDRNKKIENVSDNNELGVDVEQPKLEGRVLGENEHILLDPPEFDMSKNKRWEIYDKEKLDKTFKSVELDGVTYYIAEGEDFKFLVHSIDATSGKIKENGSSLEIEKKMLQLREQLPTHPELFSNFDYDSRVMSCSTISDKGMATFGIPLKARGKDILIGLNVDNINDVYHYSTRDYGTLRTAKPVSYNESVKSLAKEKGIGADFYDEVVVKRRPPDFMISPYAPGDSRNANNVLWAKYYGIPILYINRQSYIDKYDSMIDEIVRKTEGNRCLSPDDYQKVLDLKSSINAIYNSDISSSYHNTDFYQLQKDILEKNPSVENVNRMGTKLLLEMFIDESSSNRPSSKVYDAIINKFKLKEEHPNLTRDDIVSSLIKLFHIPIKKNPLENPFLDMDFNSILKLYEKFISPLVTLRDYDQKLANGTCLNSSEYQEYVKLLNDSETKKANIYDYAKEFTEKQLEAFKVNPTKENADIIFSSMDTSGVAAIYDHYIRCARENISDDVVFDVIISHFNLETKYPNLSKEEIVNNLIEAYSIPRPGSYYQFDFRFELKQLDKKKSFVDQCSKAGINVSKNSDGSYSFDDGWDVTTISPSVMAKHIENIKTLDDDSIKNYIQELANNTSLVENPPKNVDIYKDSNYEFIRRNFGSDISKDDSTGDYIIKNTTVSVEQMNNFINGVNLINDSEVASDILEYVKNNIMVISSGRASLVSDPKFEEAYSYFGNSIFNKDFVAPENGLQSVVDIISKVESLKQDKVLETMVNSGYDITKIFNQDILDNMNINDVNRIVEALTNKKRKNLSSAVAILAEQKNESLLHDMLDFEEFLDYYNRDGKVTDISMLTELDLKKNSIFDVESMYSHVKAEFLLYSITKNDTSNIEFKNYINDHPNAMSDLSFSVEDLSKYIKGHPSLFTNDFMTKHSKIIDVYEIIGNIKNSNDFEKIIDVYGTNGFLNDYLSILTDVHRAIQEDFRVKIKQSYDEILATAPYYVEDGVKIYDITDLDCPVYSHSFYYDNYHQAKDKVEQIKNDITLWDKISGGNPNVCGTISTPEHPMLYGIGRSEALDYSLVFRDITNHDVSYSSLSDASTPMHVVAEYQKLKFRSNECRTFDELISQYLEAPFIYNEVTIPRYDQDGKSILPQALLCIENVEKRALTDAKKAGDEWYNGDPLPIFLRRHERYKDKLGNRPDPAIVKLKETMGDAIKDVKSNADGTFTIKTKYGEEISVTRKGIYSQNLEQEILDMNKEHEEDLENNEFNKPVDQVSLNKVYERVEKNIQDPINREIAKKYFSLAPSMGVLNVLSEIILKESYNGHGFYSGLCNENDTFFDSRVFSMANLYLTHPETFEFLANNDINLFHGTNSINLDSIINEGIMSAKKQIDMGKSVMTGEESILHSRQSDYISFTDVLNIAQSYVHLNDNESFGVIIGTTSADILSVLHRNISSDLPEIGVRGEFPSEKIKTILVPESKVDIVKKMVGDKDIMVLPINDSYESLFYFNDGINPFNKGYDTVKEIVDNTNYDISVKTNDVDSFKRIMGDAIKDVKSNDDGTFTIKTKYGEEIIVTRKGIYSQNLEQEILDLNEGHEALLVNDWLLNHVDNIDSLVNEDPDRQQQINRYISKVAKTLGTDVETFKKVYAETFKRIINDSEIGMRVSNESLSKILDSGEIKNNHLVESDRLDNSETRAQHEEYLFGIPKELAGRDSAIYGMVFPKYDENDPNSTKFYKIGPGSWYGNSKSNPLTEAVIIFKKDSIMDYTTFTNHDSLEHGRNPSALGRVGGIQAPTNIKNPVQTNSWFSFNDIDTIDDLRNATLYNLSSPDDHDTTGYIEAQIYGRYNHTIDNIDHVLFLSEPSDEVIEKLNRLGIKYEISKPLEMMEQEKIIETPHDDDTQVMDVSPNSEKNSKVNPNYDLKYNITTDELIVTDNNGSIIDKLPKMINLEPKAITEFLVSCGAIKNTTPMERTLENIVSKPSELLSDADLNNIVDTLKSLNLNYIDSSIIDKFRTSDGFDYMGFLNYSLSNSEFTRESVEVFRQLEPIQRVINNPQEMLPIINKSLSDIQKKVEEYDIDYLKQTDFDWLSFVIRYVTRDSNYRLKNRDELIDIINKIESLSSKIVKTNEYITSYKGVKIKTYGNNTEFLGNALARITQVIDSLPSTLLYQIKNLSSIELYDTVSPYNLSALFGFESLLNNPEIEYFETGALYRYKSNTVQIFRPTMMDENNEYIYEILTHELGHSLDSFMITAMGTGFTETTDLWKNAVEKDNNSISAYGDLDLQEDFAEMCSLYAKAINGYVDIDKVKNEYPERFKIMSALYDLNEVVNSGINGNIPFDRKLEIMSIFDDYMGDDTTIIETLLGKDFIESYRNYSPVVKLSFARKMINHGISNQFQKLFVDRDYFHNFDGEQLLQFYNLYNNNSLQHDILKLVLSVANDFELEEIQKGLEGTSYVNELCSNIQNGSVQGILSILDNCKTTISKEEYDNIIKLNSIKTGGV